jgi:hypothetical protein
MSLFILISPRKAYPGGARDLGSAMNPDPTNKVSGGFLVLFLACLAALARAINTLPVTHKFY